MKDTLFRMLRTPSGVTSIALMLVFLIPALLAPLLAPYDPAMQFRGVYLAPPSAQHLLGTDHLGRDILSRILFGMRVSLFVAFGGVAVGTAIGVIAGVISGYLGGLWDLVLMRTSDVILAFPTVLLGIVVAVVYGRGMTSIIIAIAIYNVPTFARLTRSRVLEVRELEFISGTLALGARKTRVMLKHLLPNSMSPVFVQLGVAMGFAVFLEAALSFLGLGVQAPDPSLGQMLSDARGHLRASPLYGVLPGVAITMIIISANLLTDTIRDLWNE